MRQGILSSPKAWILAIGALLLLSPILAQAAPSCDERDCTRGGGSTAATSQPVQPTAAPATVPTEAPESIEIEPVPTDTEWINRIRTDNRTIIVKDPVIWAPTGAMTWDITISLEYQLSDWFSRHPDPTYPNYGLASQDWSTIEGHKQWLINLANSAAPATPAPQPEATPVPTVQSMPRESQLCFKAKADLAAAESRLERADAAMQLADQKYNDALAQIQIEQNALVALQAEYDALKADLKTLRGAELHTQMALMAAKKVEIERQRDVVIPAAKQAAIYEYGERDKALSEVIDAGANVTNQQKLVEIYCNQSDASVASIP